MIEGPQDFSNACILIIDDEETQRLLTRDCLEEAGFRVEEAPNGEAGLQLIRALQPDLVLLDVMMSGIDGFETCRRLRADPVIKHIPVIIVTGHERAQDIKQGFAAGATDFLTKPVNWNLLPNRIRYVLRTSCLEKYLRTAKESAEKASAAKSALMRTLGHELRTPLNAIIGFSNLIEKETLGPLAPPQYKNYFADIHAAGLRLSNAVNAVLEITDCENGTLASDQREICVLDLVDAAVKQVSREAHAASVRILNEVSDYSTYVKGDERRLQKALFNLLLNAVQFNQAGGIVRVTMACSENGWFVLCVADNGIGIPARDLPRILEPFEQADNGLTRKVEGLGLGISVTRAIVRLHGGTIDYESAVGQGTTARITLPSSRAIMSGKPMAPPCQQP